MATGIVSIAADNHHFTLISFVLAALGIIGLGCLVALALLAGKRWDYRDPDVIVRLFTFVAACAVLASRFEKHQAVSWALGAVAVAAWLTLTPVAARDMWSRRWRALREHVHGGWELASVATTGVAIVLAAWTVSTRSNALFVASAVLWVLAVLVYVVMTSLILWGAVAGAEFKPDHWILMGGLAIATLAGARLHMAADAVNSWLGHGGPAITVVTWVLATAWIPVLLYAHLVHIARSAGPLRFAGAWWAAVFPLGMYSAATQATALEMRWPALTTISLVFFWVALTAWLAVAFGAVWRFRRAQTR